MANDFRLPTIGEVAALRAHVQPHIAGLEASRAVMVAYLADKQRAEDWHSVMDAAADLCEIDARLHVLRELLE